ncbi:MAG: BPSS1780 family membrane protein [Hydrogenophilaceae bacterium]
MTGKLSIARPAASEGLAWMKAGWAWFKPAPVPWMGMTALVFLALIGVGSIPYLGGSLVEVMSPFIVAGFMSASRAAEAGQPVTFLHLGAGFLPQNRVGLAIMGGIYLAGVLLIDLIMRQMGGEGFQQLSQLAANPAAISPEQAQAILNEALPALLIGLLLLTPLVMATWFAPALVLFDGFSPGNAMWWSLWACSVNWRPLLTYSVLLGLLGVVAMLIPFGLALLVFLPWVLCSTYAAYRAIFLPAATA